MRRHIPSIIVLTLTVLISGGFFVQDYQAAQVRAAAQSVELTQARSTSAASTTELRRIDSVKLGERVWAGNPTGEQDTSLGNDVDAATWRKLTLKCDKRDGSIADVELLRPDWWLAAQEAAVGKTVYISVPECGIDGNAEVLNIEPSPPIPTGPGRIVIGRFIHHVSGTIEVTTEASADPIECTGNHPFWSESKQEFVRADSLVPGEKLRTRTLGGITQETRVVSVLPRPGPTTVYNLEVQGDHTYHVAQAGALVHNGGLPILNPCFTPIFRHYTDAAGYASIMGSGVIRANHNNQVFLTTGRYNSSQAFNTLFIGNTNFSGRGDYVIQFTVRPGASLSPGASNMNELIHYGALRNGRHIDIISSGLNPF